MTFKNISNKWPHYASTVSAPPCTVCPVCRDAIACITRTDARHHAHDNDTSCVDEWLRRQGVCPICKTPVAVASPPAAASLSSVGATPRNAPRLALELGATAGHGARTAARAIATLMTPRSGNNSAHVHRAATTAVTATPTGNGRLWAGDGGRPRGIRLTAEDLSINFLNEHERLDGNGVVLPGSAAATAAPALPSPPPVLSAPILRGRGAGPGGSVLRGGTLHVRRPASSSSSRYFFGSSSAVAATLRSAGARPWGDRGRTVRVWTETEHGYGDGDGDVGDDADDGDGDGDETGVVVTHYENPLFSHRVAANRVA